MKSLIQLVRCIQELLRDAAKARISRTTQPKRKRSDLSVPEFVAEQWKKGTKEKDEMADLLMHHNWDKDCSQTQECLHVLGCALLLPGQIRRRAGAGD